MMSIDKIQILVIIVTYNAMQWLKRCLDSLYTSSIIPDVFIVDNGSTDGTQAYIREHYTQIIFQQSNSNLGFGKANNIGLQYAIDNKYDYVYLMNQDAWVFPNTLEIMLSVSIHNPEYGILSPMQYKADDRCLDEYFCRLIVTYNGYNYAFINDILANEIKTIYAVGFVMAAHWLISRECLLKIGGFSPTFPHYGEDDNYCDRARYGGYMIGIVPKAKAVHEGGSRFIDKKKRLYISNMGNRVIFSNPNTSFHKMLCRFIYSFIRNIVKYPSISHFYNLVSLFANMRMIRHNRVISMRDATPFLLFKTDSHSE